MSMSHLSQDQIYDWIDGERTPEAGRHLGECLPCRRRLEEVERLLDRLAKMPQEVNPPEWVWDGLADRIRSGKVDAGPGQAPATTGLRGTWWSGGGHRSLYRAAAVLVLAGGAVTGLYLRNGDRSVESPVPAAAPDAAFMASLQAYERTSAALDRTFQERASDLPPGTRKALARSLAELDRAIEGVRRALAEQPNQQRLQERLSRTYRWKVKVLERAVQLTTEL